MSLFANNHREDFDFTDFMVFNKIYGKDTEESKQALIALLNTVTEDKPEIADAPIKDIIAFDSIECSNGKYCSFGFDICCESDTGNLYSVQMDNCPDEYFKGRCLIYMGHMMELSDKPQKTTMVAFIEGEDLFGNEGPYHSVQVIRDEESAEAPFNKITFHLIDIDKADDSKAVSDMTPLERVLVYFRYANDPDNEELLEQLIGSGDEAIVLAENLFKRRVADSWACKKMKLLNKYREDLADAREEGFEQGRTEGVAEGKLEIAGAMKNEGIDVNTIVRVSGLSAEVIEKLHN